VPVVRCGRVVENTEGVEIMLAGKKTYVMGSLGIVGALASYLVGDVDAAQAAQLALTAVLSMTLRNGFPK